MELNLINLASIIVAAIFVSIAVFQVLLSLGFPLGEFALGGYYKVLPKKLRILSVINAMILLFMGIVFLQHSNVIHFFSFLPINILGWIITIFLGINSVANFLSNSKKERLIMTPLSSITFILCLFIVLS